MLLPTWGLVHAQSTGAQNLRGLNDFIEYWGAARLLISGNNPYSLEQLFALQRSLGWHDEIPLIMWNPPWTLTLLIPFGLLNFVTGQLLWLIFHTAILLYCAQKLWLLYGGPARSVRTAWWVTLAFVPTYFVLRLEQIGPLIVLGIVGFLHFQRKEQWSWAGAALVLLAIKPHLVYLLWLALLLWLLEYRRWGILWGALGSGVIAALVPWIFNPSVYHHYIQLHLTAPPPTPFDWSTPTIGRALREFFVVEGVWLQLLPNLFGLLWFLFYWRMHRRTWNWIDQMPILLLVSLATSFFAWTLDHVIILPALIQGAIWIFQGRGAGVTRFPLILYVSINLICIGIKFFSPFDFWFFWLAPAWLTNFCMLRGQIVGLEVRHKQ